MWQITVLVNRLKTSPVGFTIELDESTDVAGLVTLVFVRHIESVHVVVQSLETTTKGQDMFNILDTFMKKSNLRWELCTAVCTDSNDRPSKRCIGSHQKFAPAVEASHLDREALAVTKMPSQLIVTLDEVIKVVKARSLNSRVFTVRRLVTHGWLSRAKILIKCV